jgi:hypothetical protein
MFEGIFNHCGRGYYCQELPRIGRMGIIYEVRIIGYSVSSDCGGDRGSGSREERKGGEDKEKEGRKKGRRENYQGKKRLKEK